MDSELIVKSRYNFVWYFWIGISVLAVGGGSYAAYIGAMKSRFDWRFISILVILLIFMTIFKITEVYQDKIILKTLFGNKVIKFSQIIEIEKHYPIHSMSSEYELSIEYEKNNFEIIPLGYYSNFRSIREHILFFYYAKSNKDIE